MEEYEEQPPEQTPESFLTISIILELGLGAVAIILGAIFGPDPRNVVPQLDQWQSILIGIGLGMLAALPLVGAVQLLEHLPLEPIRELKRTTEEKLMGVMVQLRTVDLLGISICAGVGEEMLFRGWLMMSLSGPMADWTTPMLAMAVILSSIAFGLAHPISPMYVVVTGLIGVYMALLLIWSGNLLVPIAAHAFYDFIQLVLMTREIRQRPSSESSE